MIANDLFSVGIPSQVSPQQHGDVSKVANGDGSMRLFYGGYRFFAGVDAVDEVAEVVVAGRQANVRWIELFVQ